MQEQDNIKSFIKLCKQDKEKLTWAWLDDLVKENNLTMTDVKSILDDIYANNTNLGKFYKLAK